MRTVVIGATGHIGSYLVPRLIARGHEVVAVSRGERSPYQPWPDLPALQRVTLDRSAEEARNAFGKRIAALEPDVVVDLICFRPESNRQLAEALAGRVQHFLHCGTIWVHGPAELVPTVESAARRPYGEYGIGKAEIEADLLRRARLGGFPATVLHPGHIVGPGWAPVNPAGNLDLRVFEHLANGRSLSLPDRGLATLHHVHADDVAAAFELAIANWSASVGESFHVVSPQAVTLQAYAHEVARWFGREADLDFLPWDAWRASVDERDADTTLDHIGRSPNASIDKARRLLGYAPRGTFEAVHEAVGWLVSEGHLRVEA